MSSFAFRAMDCSVVVVYALPVDPHGRRPEPGPSLESLVLPDLARWRFVRPAPDYQTETEEVICTTVAESLRSGVYAEPAVVALKRLRQWVGFFNPREWLFAMQLEPPAIAGDGTAFLRLMETRRRNREGLVVPIDLHARRARWRARAAVQPLNAH